MSRSYVVWNCSPAVVDQLRSSVGEQAPVVVCHSWDEVCQLVRRDEEVGLVTSQSADGAACQPANGNIGPLVHRVAVAPAQQGVGTEGTVSTIDNPTLAAQIDRVEKRIIEDTLRRNHNHRKETAADLGISRVTLYNKMKKFGLI